MMIMQHDGYDRRFLPGSHIAPTTGLSLNWRNSSLSILSFLISLYMCLPPSRKVQLVKPNNNKTVIELFFSCSVLLYKSFLIPTYTKPFQPEPHYNFSVPYKNQVFKPRGLWFTRQSWQTRSRSRGWSWPVMVKYPSRIDLIKLLREAPR